MGRTFKKAACRGRVINKGARLRERVLYSSNPLQKGLAPLLLGFWVIFFANGPSVCRAAESGPPAPKTIVDLQPFRQAISIPVVDQRSQEGQKTLINLNPRINAWYLLQLNSGGGAPLETYHLENGNPAVQKLLLDSTNPQGLIIQGNQGEFRCDLRESGDRQSLKAARASGAPYAPLCGDRIYLLNPVKGIALGSKW
jgi:hypothetical protein